MYFPLAGGGRKRLGVFALAKAFLHVKKLNFIRAGSVKVAIRLWIFSVCQVMLLEVFVKTFLVMGV